MDVVNEIVQDDIMQKVTITRVGAEAKTFDAPKVFANYYSNKASDDAKQAAIQAEAKAKQAAIDAEAKRIYNEKYAPVKAARVAELAAIKATAIKTESGLEYNIIKKGAGVKPTDGANIYIHYAGYLEDGSLFDSSYEEVNKIYGKFDKNRADQNGYQPFPFQYGKKEGLIPGFIEGLYKLSFGDKAVVFIPSKLGYGERGAGNVIPPSANIIFEIEMLEGIPPPVPNENK
jgi:FKBP-type peptidyl-prolyl cis-trans isomerase